MRSPRSSRSSRTKVSLLFSSAPFAVVLNGFYDAQLAKSTSISSSTAWARTVVANPIVAISTSC